MAYSVPYICHAHGACAALDRRSIHRELIDRSIFVVLVYQPTVGTIECKKTESESVGSERGAPLRIAPLSIVCVHSASLASKKRSGFSLPTTSPTFVRHRDSRRLLSPRHPPSSCSRVRAGFRQSPTRRPSVSSASPHEHCAKARANVGLGKLWTVERMVGWWVSGVVKWCGGGRSHADP